MKKDTKTTKDKSTKKKEKTSWLAPILFLVIAAFAVWSFYSYLELKGQLQELSSIEGQQKFQEKEAQKTVKQIQKHILVPEGVLPSVVTVSDVETLKQDQPFFRNAENGDQLIIYLEEEQAIIYRPSLDLIINVGPIAPGGNTQQSQIPVSENLNN